jgi:hypothetical protein
VLYLKADISAVSDESQIVRSGAEARCFYCKNLVLDSLDTAWGL